MIDIVNLDFRHLANCLDKWYSLRELKMYFSARRQEIEDHELQSCIEVLQLLDRKCQFIQDNILYELFVEDNNLYSRRTNVENAIKYAEMMDQIYDSVFIPTASTAKQIERHMALMKVEINDVRVQ